MNNETYKYTAKDGKTVSIPAGFAPTQIDGEDSVNDGLVITDSEGNEFVWIPVGSYNGETGKYDANDYENAHMLSTTENWSKDTTYASKNGWENPEKQIATGKSSIEKYGGFYVARYEAGVPQNATFYVEKNNEDKTYTKEDKKNVTKENFIDLKPVSKKGNQVWNLIDQINAKTLSENMYRGSSSVYSYLIDSNAWNYICKYILEDKKHIDITDSSTYGNYEDNIKTNYEGIIGLFARHTSGINWATKYEYGNVPSDYAPMGKEGNRNRLELATGICDDFKIYNIYDMAGNMWEWTTETVNYTDGQTYGVHRGGAFEGLGVTDRITRTAGGQITAYCYFDVGFRCMLYIK